MKFQRLLSSVLLLGVLSAGCYKATFVRNVPPAGEMQDEWINFWVFGLVGTQQIDVHHFCPDGNVRIVRTGRNVGTALVSLVTIGIYTPSKVYVQCGASAAPQAQQTSKATILMDAKGRPVEAVIQTVDGSVKVAKAMEPGHSTGEWVARFHDAGGQ